MVLADFIILYSLPLSLSVSLLPFILSLSPLSLTLLFLLYLPFLLPFSPLLPSSHNSFPLPLPPFLPPSLLIKTHYNFLEHRERLCHEVDTIAATNCVFEPPKDLQLPRKMKKPHSGGTPMGSSLPGKLLYSGKLSREKTFVNW